VGRVVDGETVGTPEGFDVVGRNDGIFEGKEWVGLVIGRSVGLDVKG